MAQEADLETYFCTQVARYGGETRKLKFINRRGAPDRMVWMPRWCWPKMPELKAPGEPLKEYQAREHKRLNRMGIETAKLDSRVDIDRFLGII